MERPTVYPVLVGVTIFAHMRVRSIINCGYVYDANYRAALPNNKYGFRKCEEKKSFLNYPLYSWEALLLVGFLCY